MESSIFPEVLLGNIDKFPGWTWHDKEGLLVSAGLVPVWKGLADGWSIVSHRLRQHPEKREILANIRYSLVEMARIFQYRRVQVDVKKDFREGHAFVKLLGFRPEGDMEQYGPQGETMTKYVWLMKEHPWQSGQS